MAVVVLHPETRIPANTIESRIVVIAAPSRLDGEKCCRRTWYPGRSHRMSRVGTANSIH
jgi:hypothetical protein